MAPRALTHIMLKPFEKNDLLKLVERNQLSHEEE